MAAPFVEWAVATSEGTKMPRTSWEKVGEYRAWVPSLLEQRTIADFLDIETGRVDHLISQEAAHDRVTSRALDSPCGIRVISIRAFAPQTIRHKDWKWIHATRRCGCLCTEWASVPPQPRTSKAGWSIYPMSFLLIALLRKNSVEH